MLAQRRLKSWKAAKEAVENAEDSTAEHGETPNVQAAAAKAAEFHAQKRFMPGFGHPYYKPEDPRSARLFDIAMKNGAKGDYIELVKILGEEVDKVAGRHLTLNVTGALGAILSEIDFPVEVMRACSVVGRAAGLVAHVLEEKSNPITPALVDFVNNIE